MAKVRISGSVRVTYRVRVTRTVTTRVRVQPVLKRLPRR